MSTNFVGESFSVSLISGIEKFYAQEGNITIFYRKLVVSQYRNFVGEQFCVLQNFRYPKNLWVRGEREVGREYHDFLSKKVFCFTVPKNFVGELFSVSLNSGIEKFYA